MTPAAPKPRRWLFVAVVSTLLFVVSIVCWYRAQWYTGVRLYLSPANEDPSARRWMIVLTSNSGSLRAGLSHHNGRKRWIEFENDDYGAGYATRLSNRRK